jgi:hypothetical protein
MHKPYSEVFAPPLTVAYVVKGFWNYITPLEVKSHPNPIYNCEEIRNGGEIGLMSDLINRADYAEQEWQRRFANDDYGFAGVWEYEVSEVFGEDIAKYLVEHKRLPDEAWCQTKVAELAMAMAQE